MLQWWVKSLGPPLSKMLLVLSKRLGPACVIDIDRCLKCRFISFHLFNINCHFNFFLCVHRVLPPRLPLKPGKKTVFLYKLYKIHKVLKSKIKYQSVGLENPINAGQVLYNLVRPDLSPQCGVNTRDRSGWTPHHFALREKCFSVLVFLSLQRKRHK